MRSARCMSISAGGSCPPLPSCALPQGMPDVVQTAPLLNLPLSVLELLLVQIDDASLCCCAQTCRAFRAATSAHNLWTLKCGNSFGAHWHSWLAGQPTGCFTGPHAQLAPVTHRQEPQLAAAGRTARGLEQTADAGESTACCGTCKPCRACGGTERPGRMVAAACAG